MVSYYLLNTLTGYITEQSNKEQMERQIKTQKEKYEQLASSFIQGNRLIHDVNKHNQMIKSIWKNLIMRKQSIISRK